MYSLVAIIQESVVSKSKSLGWFEQLQGCPHILWSDSEGWSWECLYLAIEGRLWKTFGESDKVDWGDYSQSEVEGFEWSVGTTERRRETDGDEDIEGTWLSSIIVVIVIIPDRSFSLWISETIRCIHSHQEWRTRISRVDSVSWKQSIRLCSRNEWTWYLWWCVQCMFGCVFWG